MSEGDSLRGNVARMLPASSMTLPVPYFRGFFLSRKLLLLCGRVGTCGRSPGRQAPGPPAAPRAAFAPPRSAQQPLRQLSSSMRSLSCDARDTLTPAQHAQILGFRSVVRSTSSSAARSPRFAAASAAVHSSGSAWGSCSKEAAACSSGGSKDNDQGSSTASGGACSGALAAASSGNAWSFGRSNPARGLQRRR
jgi:hypothetical protein